MALQLLPRVLWRRLSSLSWWVGFAVVFCATRQHLMLVRLLHAVAFGVELEVAAALLWLQDVSDRSLDVFEHLPSASPFLVTCFILLVTLSNFHVCQMCCLPASHILILKMGT